MHAAPRIACLDLDTFFVSVERLLDRRLLGVPVVVGGLGGRGVVTSASYEVRALGVRSGMSIADARRRAPNAVYLPVRHGVYGPYADRVRTVLERYTPVVQAASIDEFFLDFRGCERLWARPEDEDDDATVARVARAMRLAVQVETGLPSSVGLGSNRAIAKIASGRAKPAGVVFVRSGREAAFVAELPIRKFPGIGPVAERRLQDGGVFVLGQLAEPTDAVQSAFPEHVASVRAAVFPDEVPALGPDRPAFHEHDPHGDAHGSMSNERTFRDDVHDPNVVIDQVRSLAEHVAWRVRKRGVLARTVVLKLRYSDFQTISRSRTVPATDDPARMAAVALELLKEGRTRALPIRLLGVGVSNLQLPAPQLALPLSTQPAALSAVDAVRARFGYEAIRLGRAR